MEKQTRIFGSFKHWPQKKWSWIKNNGGYDNKRDFFRMHWEVQDNYPDRVHFHVEAPAYDNDPELNLLKQKVILKIINSDIEKNARSNNLNYVKGRFTSLKSIKKNRQLHF